MQNKLRNGYYTPSAKVQVSPQHDRSMQEPRRRDLGPRARQALKTRQTREVGQAACPATCPNTQLSDILLVRLSRLVYGIGMFDPVYDVRVAFVYRLKRRSTVLYLPSSPSTSPAASLRAAVLPLPEQMASS